MNYLENKVKELFEQVLRGEKKAPQLSIGNVTKAHYLKFSKDLLVIKKEGWLSITLKGSDIPLFEEDLNKWESYERKVSLGVDAYSSKPTPSENMLLVSKLFDEVVEYTKKPQADKYLIDKIFGDLK